MDPYPWIKTRHVLLAVVAVGSNMTYGISQARGASEPQRMVRALVTKPGSQHDAHASGHG